MGLVYFLLVFVLGYAVVFAVVFCVLAASENLKRLEGDGVEPSGLEARRRSPADLESQTAERREGLRISVINRAAVIASAISLFLLLAFYGAVVFLGWFI